MPAPQGQLPNASSKPEGAYVSHNSGRSVPNSLLTQSSHSPANTPLSHSTGLLSRGSNYRGTDNAQKIPNIDTLQNYKSGQQGNSIRKEYEETIPSPTGKGGRHQLSPLEVRSDLKANRPSQSLHHSPSRVVHPGGSQEASFSPNSSGRSPLAPVQTPSRELSKISGPQQHLGAFQILSQNIPATECSRADSGRGGKQINLQNAPSSQRHGHLAPLNSARSSAATNESRAGSAGTNASSNGGGSEVAREAIPLHHFGNPIFNVAFQQSQNAEPKKEDITKSNTTSTPSNLLNRSNLYLASNPVANRSINATYNAKNTSAAQWYNDNDHYPDSDNSNSRQNPHHRAPGSVVSTLSREDRSLSPVHPALTRDYIGGAALSTSTAQQQQQTQKAYSGAYHTKAPLYNYRRHSASDSSDDRASVDVTNHSDEPESEFDFDEPMGNEMENGSPKGPLDASSDEQSNKNNDPSLTRNYQASPSISIPKTGKANNDRKSSVDGSEFGTDANSFVVPTTRSQMKPLPLKLPIDMTGNSTENGITRGNTYSTSEPVTPLPRRAQTSSGFAQSLLSFPAEEAVKVGRRSNTVVIEGGDRFGADGSGTAAVAQLQATAMLRQIMPVTPKQQLPMGDAAIGQKGQNHQERLPMVKPLDELFVFSAEPTSALNDDFSPECSAQSEGAVDRLAASCNSSCNSSHESSDVGIFAKGVLIPKAADHAFGLLKKAESGEDPIRLLFGGPLGEDETKKAGALPPANPIAALHQGHYLSTLLMMTPTAVNKKQASPGATAELNSSPMRVPLPPSNAGQEDALATYSASSYSEVTAEDDITHDNYSNSLQNFTAANGSDDEASGISIVFGPPQREGVISSSAPKTTAPNGTRSGDDWTERLSRATRNLGAAIPDIPTAHPLLAPSASSPTKRPVVRISDNSSKRGATFPAEDDAARGMLFTPAGQTPTHKDVLKSPNRIDHVKKQTGGTLLELFTPAPTFLGSPHTTAGSSSVRQQHPATHFLPAERGKNDGRGHNPMDTDSTTYPLNTSGSTAGTGTGFLNFAQRMPSNQFTAGTDSSYPTNPTDNAFFLSKKGDQEGDPCTTASNATGYTYSTYASSQTGVSTFGVGGGGAMGGAPATFEASGSVSTFGLGFGRFVPPGVHPTGMHANNTNNIQQGAPGSVMYSYAGTKTTVASSGDGGSSSVKGGNGSATSKEVKGIVAGLVGGVVSSQSGPGNKQNYSQKGAPGTRFGPDDDEEDDESPSDSQELSAYKASHRHPDEHGGAKAFGPNLRDYSSSSESNQIMSSSSEGAMLPLTAMPRSRGNPFGITTAPPSMVAGGHEGTLQPSTSGLVPELGQLSHLNSSTGGQHKKAMNGSASAPQLFKANEDTNPPSMVVFGSFCVTPQEASQPNILSENGIGTRSLGIARDSQQQISSPSNQAEMSSPSKHSGASRKWGDTETSSPIMQNPNLVSRATSNQTSGEVPTNGSPPTANSAFGHLRDSGAFASVATSPTILMQQQLAKSPPRAEPKRPKVREIASVGHGQQAQSQFRSAAFAPVGTVLSIGAPPLANPFAKAPVKEATVVRGESGYGILPHMLDANKLVSASTTTANNTKTTVVEANPINLVSTTAATTTRNQDLSTLQRSSDLVVALADSIEYENNSHRVFQESSPQRNLTSNGVVATSNELPAFVLPSRPGLEGVVDIRPFGNHPQTTRAHEPTQAINQNNATATRFESGDFDVRTNTKALFLSADGSGSSGSGSAGDRSLCAFVPFNAGQPPQPPPLHTGHRPTAQPNLVKSVHPLVFGQQQHPQPARFVGIASEYSDGSSGGFGVGDGPFAPRMLGGGELSASTTSLTRFERDGGGERGD